MRLITIALFAALSLPAATVSWAQDGEIITKQYDDGSVYEGTFKDGRQHGTGTYRLTSGFEYTGEWVEGEITGQGTARYPNGSVYEGTFVKGQPEGKGKITAPDGRTYEGDWVQGQMTGQGIATYANGSVYEGGFVRGQHDG
ncbi:MAG: 2-isopropylmalate synthase, partial [Tabrizicola sp.]|nr:2-isopropylmalate synthase [Tabrizicola sp.]